MKALAYMLAVAIAVVSILAQYVPTAACTYNVAKITTTSCVYITETQTTTAVVTYVTNSTVTTTSVVTTTVVNTHTQCSAGLAGAVANMTCTWNTPTAPPPPSAGAWRGLPGVSTFADYAVAALALGLMFAAFAAKTSEMSNNYMIVAIAMFVLSAALASLSPTTAALSALSAVLALTSVLIFLRRR